MQGFYIEWSVFPGYGVLLECHISDLMLDEFLLFSIARIELRETVYITHLMFSLFCISHIAIFIAEILAVWIEASLGSALLLVMSTYTAAKPTNLPVPFDPSV